MQYVEPACFSCCSKQKLAYDSFANTRLPDIVTARPPCSLFPPSRAHYVRCLLLCLPFDNSVVGVSEAQVRQHLEGYAMHFDLVRYVRLATR